MTFRTCIVLPQRTTIGDLRAIQGTLSGYGRASVSPDLSEIEFEFDSTDMASEPVDAIAVEVALGELLKLRDDGDADIGTIGVDEVRLALEAAAGTHSTWRTILGELQAHGIDKRGIAKPERI